MKYRIRSGEMDVEIDAPDHHDAARKAVLEYATWPLGLIMEVAVVGGDPDKDGWYMSTERVLQDAGIDYKRKDGVTKMEPRQTAQ